MMACTQSRVAFILVSLISVLAIPGLSDDEIADSMEIAFCNLNVSEHIRDANYSSSIIYSFSIDENGHPVDIAVVRDEFVGEREVQECLASWRFSGPLISEGFSVAFSWQHGVGWVKMAVSGAGRTTIVTLPGDHRSQYSKR